MPPIMSANPLLKNSGTPAYATYIAHPSLREGWGTRHPHKMGVDEPPYAPRRKVTIASSGRQLKRIGIPTIPSPHEVYT